MKNFWKLCCLAGLMAITGGCSSQEGDELLPADDWKVSLSRGITQGQPVTVALRYGNTASYGTLKPAAQENAMATWEGNPPVWPDNSTTAVEVIAFSPTVNALPATVSATDGKAWLMDYVSCTANNKPASFEMAHLMAQLEVHIKLHDDAAHHYEPKDAAVGLYTTATVDYPNKCLIITPATMNEIFPLGTFTKVDGSTNSDENWVNTVQVVIPQTLAAGVPCLTFKAGDKTYTFTPEEDITLNPGKKTKLYLGVAYENEHATLAPEGVIITPWQSGETYEDNIYNPNNN